MMGKYDDIIGLPHHQSVKHPHMPSEDRAAQFMPFAALTGYGDAVDEAGRLTDERIDLEENYIEILDRKLQLIGKRIKSQPEVEITYFEKDAKKEGGSYQTIRKNVKKIDTYENVIVMVSGERIAINDIVDLKTESTGGYKSC